MIVKSSRALALSSTLAVVAVIMVPYTGMANYGSQAQYPPPIVSHTSTYTRDYRAQPNSVAVFQRSSGGTNYPMVSYRPKNQQLISIEYKPKDSTYTKAQCPKMTNVDAFKL